MEEEKFAGLYVPEVILGNSYWSQVRRFERSFYDGTVIDCVRIIKKDIFEQVGGFDSSLTGSEDWDFDNNFFDIILSSQSIEHLHNTRLYLEECYRCLRAGGQLVVLTENLASWLNIGALFFGWQPFSTTNINGWHLGNPLIRHWHNEPKNKEFLKKYQDTGVSGTIGHIRVLTFRGLTDLLGKVGFKNVKVYTTGYLPFWGKLSDFLCCVDKRHGHFIIASAVKRE